jgi:hypothetical protein
MCDKSNHFKTKYKINVMIEGKMTQLYHIEYFMDNFGNM